MELAAQETSLLDLARRLKVQVRREAFAPAPPDRSRGGLCLLRGRPVVLIDPSLSLVERVVLLSEALCTFDYDPETLAEPVRCRLELARRRHRGRKLMRRPVLRRVV